MIRLIIQIDYETDFDSEDMMDALLEDEALLHEIAGAVRREVVRISDEISNNPHVFIWKWRKGDKIIE